MLENRVKERQLTVYDAFDGTAHDSEAKCLAYERTILWKRLVGLTELEVQKALEYVTPEGKEIGDVIAVLGGRIYETRRKLKLAEPHEPPRRRRKLAAPEEAVDG
jgi:hypothetical protein